LQSGICSYENGQVKQRLFPSQPPGRWPAGRWGAVRRDWAPPEHPPAGTHRLVIGATTEDQPSGETGWGVVMVLGGWVGPRSRIHTAQDVVGEMALGDIIGEAGGRGGEDAIASALSGWCAALEAIVAGDLTPRGGDLSEGLMVCLPVGAMRMLAGLSIPEPQHAKQCQEARTLWDMARKEAETERGNRLWLAGPDPGPRGSRAKALARGGAWGPIGDFARPGTGAPRHDPWQHEDRECPVCLTDFTDMLPDPVNGLSRATPYRCMAGHRHGTCWECCQQLKDRDQLTRCPICRAPVDPQESGAFRQ
jgi:hypothetical protein